MIFLVFYFPFRENPVADVKQEAKDVKYGTWEESLEASRLVENTFCSCAASE